MGSTSQEPRFPTPSDNKVIRCVLCGGKLYQGKPRRHINPFRTHKPRTMNRVRRHITRMEANG